MVGQALPNAIHDGVIHSSRRAVLLEHAADSWRPSDQIPLGEGLFELKEDVPGEDPAVLPVADTTGLRTRRRWELRRVCLDFVQDQVLAHLRLAVGRSVKDMPHRCVARYRPEITPR